MGFFDIIDQPALIYGPETKYPLFNRFSLETSSYCNRSCSFCPVSNGARPNQILMREELFEKILWELHELQYDGILSLFFLNEPTLDKRLFKGDNPWCSRIRQALPKATIYASTNGDAFRSVEDIAALFDAGLTVLNLNIYDSGPEQALKYRTWAEEGDSQDLWELTEHKYRKHSVRRRYLAISDMRMERDDYKIVDSWMVKNADQREGITAPQRHCARTHRHLITQYDGRVPLCCGIDNLVENALFVGDLNTQSIEEIWNCEELYKYRWFLQHARRELPWCSTCNHRMAYSHVVRFVTPDTPERRDAWENCKVNS
jgi:hypothetical protein